MAMIKCPECGAEISDRANICPHCGVAFGKRKFCKFCGELIDEDCVVCPKCGKQVEDLKGKSDDRNIIINNNNNNSSSSSASAAAAAFASGGGSYVPSVSSKSWLVTLLLCLFLGIFGVHRFYVGKIGTGILMILLCATGISEIWCLIDFICILLKRFKDKHGLPIKK